MKLDKHIDNAAILYKNTYKELDELRTEKKAEEIELHKNKHRLRDEIFNEEMASIKSKYDLMKANIIKAHSEELAKIEKEYVKEVDAFYQPDGSAIDQNDRILLESGILKPNEIMGLIAKHKDNTTMLRIISQKTKEETLDALPPAVQRTLLLAEKAGENEKMLFNSFNQSMGNPIRMASQGLHETATETFLNAVSRADRNIDVAKRDILKAELFISEETQSAIDAYETGLNA